MIRSVLIIDCTDKAYNGRNHPALALGGIERTVVGLAEALARKGLGVSVWNNTPEFITENGVTWIPRKSTAALERYDAVIACNDARLLGAYARASGQRTFKTFMWFHNSVSFEKSLRKGRMPDLLRRWPVGIFLGAAHEERASRLIPLRKRVIVPHALDRAILENIPPPATEQDAPRPPVAVFISQPYRGLAEMVAMWRSHIHPQIPAARLRVYCARATPAECGNLSAEELAAIGIDVMPRLPRAALMDSLGQARVALIPGHSDETFCLAAAECLALRIPVMTYGTGALKERVRQGENGFIAAGKEDFAAHLLQILRDDALWHRLHTYGLPEDMRESWDQIADKWLPLFQEAR